VQAHPSSVSLHPTENNVTTGITISKNGQITLYILTKS
jgi:hypothetical protein